MPTMALPTAIAVVPCSTTPSGAAICQTGSVAASLMHFTQFFDPHFYDASASLVIASVLGFQLQAFGLPSFSPITMDSLPSIITLKFLLTTIPSPVRDARGHHKVAACVTWGGDLSSAAPPGGWSRARCTTGDVDGAQFIECFCTRTSYIASVGGGAQHTVLNVPGDCTGTPYGSQSMDGCAVCGGDNSTCRGCDGKVASGLVLDVCLVCGGDDSWCAGCDGFPNSGKTFDECGLCGGDNSTCTGCDGIAIHQSVTARTGLQPTSYDSCVSAAHPNGVCGGCDASCKGCDGIANSGKDFDKCQLCGPYFPGSDGQYTVANKDQSCPLGLLDCGSGFVADACGVCVAIDAPEVSRNQECLGCDSVPRVFGRKVIDACSLCGGDGCSCTDCSGVVNGGAKRDKCGVCKGNNTCLDCFAVPFGPYTLDICGVCGGTNDTSQCSGCDGKIHRRPLTPPRFDSNFKCCPAHLVGTGAHPERQLGQACGDICNATIGCDKVCSTTPKAVDRCGVCGGWGAASTGTCDCEGVPYGRSLFGCDGVCRDPPVVLDECAVCGGGGEKNTGIGERCSVVPGNESVTTTPTPPLVASSFAPSPTTADAPPLTMAEPPMRTHPPPTTPAPSAAPTVAVALPANPTYVEMAVRLPLALSEFTAANQAGFVRGVAAAAGVPDVTWVEITSISESATRRRLATGVDVEFRVATASAAAQAAAAGLIASGLNAALATQGLPAATALRAASVAENAPSSGATPVQPSEVGSSKIGLIAGAVGGGALVLAVGALCVVRRRRHANGKLPSVYPPPISPDRVLACTPSRSPPRTQMLLPSKIMCPRRLRLSHYRV